MLQIKNMLGGGKPEGLHAWKKSEIGSELKDINKRASALPFAFYEGSAVVLNGEIHILGGSSNYTSHYKWDGTSWTSVSTLPYNFYEGSAVILNGEIHILGSYRSAKHYKWDGTSWTSVSTLPYGFNQGSAVVLNGEIHILGGTNNYTKHYKWDGTSWTSVSTLPYSFYQGSAVVLNNEIHILGSYSSGDYADHYKFDGTSWTSVSTLPYNFYQGSAVVFDDKIHILGSASGGSYYTAHYLIIGYVPVYTFLDYIVSDKENAYPDGGEKGGYWYEKVRDGLTPEMFGCTKYEVGSFTLSSDNYTVSFNHTLGEKPKAVIINENSSITDSNYVNTYLAPSSYGAYVYSNRASGNSASGNTLNESTVTVTTGNTSRNFKSGVKYNYVLLA